MTKIHCLNPIAKCGTELFSAGCEMTDNMTDTDAVLTRSASMHDTELPENLLAVGRAGTGVNNVPLDSCAQKDIVVFNTPGTNANSVRELVIAGMLMASQDTMGGIEWCGANAEDDNITKDTEKSKKAFTGCEIKSKKLGVIGLGAIGARITNAVTHLGMEIYEHDPHIPINAVWRLSRDAKYVTNTDTISQKCDYVTIHVPLMDPTRGTTNKGKLAIMKDRVIVLNFPKDILVNDDDIAAVLGTGKAYYYVSDFPNPEVASTERTILLPHLGAPIRESEDNCAVMAMEGLVDYLENGNIKNSANFPSCDMGICQAESRMAVLHTNIPNMIRQITAILAEQGMDISDMTNKSGDRYAYALLDLERKTEDFTIRKLRAIKDVLRVRVVE